jgi:hypothetical protein
MLNPVELGWFLDFFGRERQWRSWMKGYSSPTRKKSDSAAKMMSALSASYSKRCLKHSSKAPVDDRDVDRVALKHF